MKKIAITSFLMLVASVSALAHPKSDNTGLPLEGFYTQRQEIPLIEKVTRIVAQQFKVEMSEVSLETHFKQDLGAGDTDMVAFIMELERQFNVSIPDAEAEKFKRVHDVTSYFNRVLEK